MGSLLSFSLVHSYARVLGHLGRVYLKLGHDEKALDLLQTAVELKRVLENGDHDDPRDEVALHTARRVMGKQLVHKQLQGLEMQRILDEHRNKQLSQQREQEYMQQLERLKQLRRELDQRNRMLEVELKKQLVHQRELMPKVGQIGVNELATRAPVSQALANVLDGLKKAKEDENALKAEEARLKQRRSLPTG
jgi:hypothetical protein